MATKPWGIGAWAAEAEREEAEEKERAAAEAAAMAAAAPSPSSTFSSSEAFPTISEALAKPKKKKQSQSLYEFTYGISVGPGTRSRTDTESRGLTPQEMMMLPTGPRARSGEEDDYRSGGLGGAFRDYRGGGGTLDRYDRERDRGGFGSGYDRNRETGSGFLRDRGREEPSRADDSSSWSSTKRSSSFVGSGYGAGGGFAGERRGSGTVDRELPPSRADEADNWGLVKKSLPLAHVDARDSRAGRREVLQESGLSRADEADNWSRSKSLATAPTGYDAGPDASRWGRREQQGFEEPQRRRLSLAPRSGPTSTSTPPGSVSDPSDALPPLQAKPKPNPFGSARPREEILAERGLDRLRLDGEPAAKERDSRPSSSHSSRPDTPEVTGDTVGKSRPKINPFGNAKPREVLLEEQGKDWRKMDFELEHRGVERPETQEELRLKEEIKVLTELSKQEGDAASQMNGVASDEMGHSKENLLDTIRMKERELELLTRSLDDKVRFSQKIGERPGSRSGRSDVSSRADSRPGSRSGRSDTGRSFDYSDRTGFQLGNRPYDSAERSSSHSEVFRSLDPGDRVWSRSGRVESGESQERWSGSSDSGRSFDSLRRTRSRALPPEGGRFPSYPQEGGGPDIWTRSNESARDRQGSWVDRDGSNAGRRF